jgi:hypothetical protein
VTNHVAAAAVVAALMLLGGSATVAAQSLGVKGGVNVSTIKISPPEDVGVDVSGQIGLTAGGFMGFRDAAKLGFELGGQLSIRRVSFGPEIADTITYIEVPALARYAFVRTEGTTIRALGGGSLGFRIAASESVSGESSSATDSYKPLDFAIVVGAQVEWKNRWVFEGRYLFGLSDVYEVTAGFETSQRGFQVLVGYRLR